MKKRIKAGLLVCFVFLVFCCPVSFADVGTEEAVVNDKLMTLVESLQKELNNVKAAQADQASMYEKKIASLEKQLSGMNSELGKVNNQVQASLSAPKAVPVQQVSAGNIPSWLEGTSYGGDIRVRFQDDFNNSSVTADRHRGRIRARFYASKQISDELYARMRLVTGTASDTQAANATVNGFNLLDVALDEAYLKYEPNSIDGLTLYAGKFPINWTTKGVVFDDLNRVDGLAESYAFDINDSLSADFNAAQLIVSESASEDGDSELYVFDGGVTGETSSFDWGLHLTSFIFAGYHDGGSAAIGGSNSSTLEDPRVFMATADLGFMVNNLPVSTFIQGAINTNANTKDSDVRDQDKYFGLGFGLGELEAPGDLAFCYMYLYGEKDVMPTGLVDGDLIGGQKTHYGQISYQLFSSTVLDLEMYLPRSLDGDGETGRFMSKLNLTTKF